MTLRDAIKYHTDKGTTQHALLQELKSHRTSTLDERLAEISAMIVDGTLTIGQHEGTNNFIVVTEWMPQTAAKMQNEEPPGHLLWGKGKYGLASDPPDDQLLEEQGTSTDMKKIRLGKVRVGRIGGRPTTLTDLTRSKNSPPET